MGAKLEKDHTRGGPRRGAEADHEGVEGIRRSVRMAAKTLLPPGETTLQAACIVHCGGFEGVQWKGKYTSRCRRRSGRIWVEVNVRWCSGVADSSLVSLLQYFLQDCGAFPFETKGYLRTSVNFEVVKAKSKNYLFFFFFCYFFVFENFEKKKITCNN